MAAAPVSLRGQKSVMLMDESSILTAELCGVLCVLQIVAAAHSRQYVIFTDSQRALKVIEHLLKRKYC